MITSTNLDIELDGEGQSYVYDPTDQGATTSDFNYNVTVYSKTGLANQQHNLVINLQPGSWIAFDWLEYTRTTDPCIPYYSSHIDVTPHEQWLELYFAHEFVCGDFCRDSAKQFVWWQ
ncbi:hypothetical protein DAEQUDRAFT_44614 [Daedalea quercina L-15889]|uniref:Uncharacterized protein n=1 Tax=Daedalea quercina L-15889 TaxID=1314783 RepID=A0A165LCZ4_9APHY|nr:hypothetical protein DAEQUDRAFT_44614 [Daedalea quercina L-15889]